MSILEKDVLKDKILVTRIDGQWTTGDLIYYLRWMDNLVFYVNTIYMIQLDRDFKPSWDFRYKNRINSIQYSSPGWIEVILPATTVVTILGMIKHYIPNKKDKAEQKKIEAEVKAQEIKNLKEMGFTDDEIKLHFHPYIENISSYLYNISKFQSRDLITEWDEKDLEEDEEFL